MKPHAGKTTGKTTAIANQRKPHRNRFTRAQSNNHVKDHRTQAVRFCRQNVGIYRMVGISGLYPDKRCKTSVVHYAFAAIGSDYRIPPGPLYRFHKFHQLKAVKESIRISKYFCRRWGNSARFSDVRQARVFAKAVASSQYGFDGVDID